MDMQTDLVGKPFNCETWPFQRVCQNDIVQQTSVLLPQSVLLFVELQCKKSEWQNPTRGTRSNNANMLGRPVWADSFCRFAFFRLTLCVVAGHFPHS